MVVPARAFSSPWAIILTPAAASIVSTDSHRSPASRISDIPRARFNPLMRTSNGPSALTTVMVSVTLSEPRCRITSIVFPIPISSFISRIVPSAGPSVSVRRSSRKRSAKPTVTVSRSCNPSPSLADIGTRGNDCLKSLIWSYRSRLIPCSET